MNLIYDKWRQATQFQMEGKKLSQQVLDARKLPVEADLVNSNLDLEFHDPFLFNDMDKAVETLTHFIANRSVIMIHGDYDADGLTATAILYLYFKTFGIKVLTHIPDRFEDGYGLSANGVNRAVAEQVDLLITVDCGITSHKEVDMLNQAGITTIITDHHQCLETLPPAKACINPQWRQENYPFRFLSGAGVALKLVQALCIKFHQEDLWLNFLDLAMIGTISDVMPLQGENLILVRAGLAAANSDPRPLFKTLITQSYQQNINAGTVGFQIAPKINAAGRMGNINPALQILLTSDMFVARQLAEELIKLNDLRRELEQQVLAAAEKMIDEKEQFFRAPVLLVADKNWHSGVLGIVASRLTSKYRRPAIVLAQEVDENEQIIYRGSGRSYGDFNILAFLRYFSSYLDRFGGHSKAVGLSLSEASLQYLQKTLFLDQDKLDFTWPTEQILACDLVLPLSQCNLDNYHDLQLLQPFGAANAEPTFKFADCLIIQKRILGKEKQHLQLLLQSDDGRRIKSIMFNGAFWYELLETCPKIDVLATMQLNSWQGIDDVQLNIIDIHLSSGENLIDATVNNPSVPPVTELPLSFARDLVQQKEFFTGLYRFWQLILTDKWQIVDANWLRMVWYHSFSLNFSDILIQNILTLWRESDILEFNICQLERRKLFLLRLAQPTIKHKLSALPSYKKLFKGEN